MCTTCLRIPASASANQGPAVQEYTKPRAFCGYGCEPRGEGARDNLAHIRHSRPDSGLGFQTKVLETGVWRAGVQDLGLIEGEGFELRSIPSRAHFVDMVVGFTGTARAAVHVHHLVES